jgi:hypothetical protein
MSRKKTKAKRGEEEDDGIESLLIIGGSLVSAYSLYKSRSGEIEETEQW